jgi:hypothetical protein
VTADKLEAGVYSAPVTTNTARIVTAGALLLALGGALAAAGPPRGAFGAAVLRRDGVIIPFAVFDGKRWTSHWPLADVEALVPITIRDVPSAWWGPARALETWQAWIGGEAHSLRIAQLDWVSVHCVRQIGLRSDYKAAVPALVAGFFAYVYNLKRQAYLLQWTAGWSLLALHYLGTGLSGSAGSTNPGTAGSTSGTAGCARGGQFAPSGH